MKVNFFVYVECLFSRFSRLDADNHLFAEFKYLNLKLIMFAVRSAS